MIYEILFSADISNYSSNDTLLNLETLYLCFYNKELEISNAVLFRTDRSLYIRFNFMNERWTIELGNIRFSKEGPGWEKEDQQIAVINKGDYKNQLIGSFFFDYASRKCNKEVNKKAIENKLDPYLFTCVGKPKFGYGSKILRSIFYKPSKRIKMVNRKKPVIFI